VTRSNRSRLLGLGVLAISGLVASGAPAADGLRLRMDYGLNRSSAAGNSLDALLGFQTRTTGSGNMRLIWEKTLGKFRINAQSRLSFGQGDGVAFAAAVSPFLPAALPATLFDLTRTWQASGNSSATNTIDRLSISYASPHVVVRLGRQAITWGGGMVFHPADIIAPFAPNTLDTSYKPGVDMAYAQYLFDNGADIQAIWVPRGVTVGGPAAFAASTFAVRARMMLGPVDTALMLARDRGDDVASLTLSGPLAGTSWTLEGVQWNLASGAVATSYLANISNFATLAGRNISYFAEYYHNGFGVDASVAYGSLPATLTKRMSTGQVFNAGGDFLALGGRIELTSDLSLTPNAIVSLNSSSALAGVSLNYNLDDNTNLLINYQVPLGRPGTEFGGRETTTGSGVYITAPRALTLQMVRYF